MDEEQFAALRNWGEGLVLDERPEVRAAGKAILLLCAEVERLEIDLWNVRNSSPAPDELPGDELSVTEAEEPTQILLRRARRLLRSRFGGEP